jgi:cytochrome P450
MRREAPVHWCEPAELVPFWAITKHAHICEISKQPDVFASGNGIVPASKEVAERLARGERGPFDMMQTIITMDPPKHRKFRKVASPWFTPHALARIDAVVQASARRLVDRLYDAQRNGEGTFDFVTEIAVQHPLRILCSILGVAEADEPTVLRLTQELFAGDDPEFARSEADRNAAMQALGIEFLQFFGKIIADRRANPQKDDLAGILANAEIDGARMGDLETLGYTDHLHGRPRHHAQQPGRRHARAGREPGRAREAAPATRGARRRRRRRDRALVHARELHDAHGHAGLRAR